MYEAFAIEGAAKVALQQGLVTFTVKYDFKVYPLQSVPSTDILYTPTS